MHTCATLVCVMAVVACSWAAAGAAGLVWSGTTDVDAPTRATTVEPAVGGGLTLVDRQLIADEIGKTVNAPSGSVHEYVAGNLWVKKAFVLDDPTAAGATLSIYASETTSKDPQELVVTFNGTALTYRDARSRVRPHSGVFDEKAADGAWTGQPFKSYWEGGWQRVPVPANLLRRGTNVVIMRAKEGHRWRFMIEESLHPDRSARSLDGGLTWDRDHLSALGNLNGEYIVRLLLDRHPPEGWVESPVIDLWQDGDSGGIGRPLRVSGLTLAAETVTPRGTRVDLLGRLGPTPTFDPATWTAWAPAADLAQGRAHGRRLLDADYRFAQWRAVLTTTAPLAAPTLKSVTASALAEPVVAEGGTFQLVTLDQPPIVRTSVPFVHGRRDKRMRLLEERFKLRQVIAGFEDERLALTRLARWVAAETTVGNHKAGDLLRDAPDYDALLTLETAGKNLTHGMCVHEGAVFAQCATALGWPARRATWSHAIAEVWLNGERKWGAFDASAGRGYCTEDGKAIGFVEIANLWKPGAGPDHPVRWSTAKGTISKPGREPEWFTRFWMPWRSNFLETPSPDEPGHGNQAFKYNGSFRYRHPDKEPFPWFDFMSRRVGDFNFTCNGTNLHLARGTSPGSLEVVLEHDMPNFRRFEVRTDESKTWTATDAAFTWHLKAGENTLEARALNVWQAEAVDSGDPKEALTVLSRLKPITAKAVVTYREGD